MEKIINNSFELENEIAAKLIKAVDYMMEKIKSKNKDFIDELIYNTPQGKIYERTGQFGEAWDFISGAIGDYITGEFFYSPSAANYTIDPPYHASVVDGSPMTQGLADVIYEGRAGKIFGKGFWTQKRNAYKMVDKWLTNSEFRKIFEEGMTNANIPWKRSTGGLIKTVSKE